MGWAVDNLLFRRVNYNLRRGIVGYMDRVREAYEEIYTVLKSEGVETIEGLEISEDSKAEARERIRTLPHPDVATRYDIREVCEELRRDSLYEFHYLVGEQVELILAHLEEEQLDDEIPSSHEGELAEVKHQLHRQTRMLRDISFKSGQAASGVNRTLKSNCVQCGSDLKIYVDQSGSKDELMLSCRGCNNEWSLQLVP